jgi:hypothetical protein
MASSMIQVLVQALQCNRRAPTFTATTQKEIDRKPQDEPMKMCKADSDSLSTCDDVSDPGSLGHTDSSSESMDAHSSPKLGISPPPGIAPPPGLNAPVVRSGESTNNPSTRYWERVISHQPQQTAFRAEAGRRQQRTSPANDPLVALKQALDNLAPTEISKVRSLLDSKMRDSGEGCTQRCRVEAPWRSSQDRKSPPWTGSNANRATTRPAKHNVMPNDMDDTGDSLRSFLLELAHMDDACVLSVRKINKLGFGSAPLLQTYFSKFGTVQRVMVAPTVVKCKSQKTRMRPACLGFVVMKTAAEVDAALQLGEAHIVSPSGEAVEFSVFPFSSHAI